MKIFVAYIAVADPEFVGPLLIPCRGRFGPVDLNAEPVLASGGNLTGGHAAPRARSHAKDNGAKVFRIDGGFDVIFRTEHLIGKGFDGVLRLLAGFVERLEIGAERLVTRSPVTCSAISNQCEPISAMQREGPPALVSTRQFQSVS